MFVKLRQILVFPVAFFYVMAYLLFYFLKLFLEGNYVEHILQILFVKMQNRLDMLVVRAAWFAPFVYIIIVWRLWGWLHAKF